MLGVDISAWTKKNWIGTGATYFFTFLAIWVLAINTPFVDLTDPGIEDVTVWVNNGTNVTGVIYKEAPGGQLAWLYVENGTKVETVLIHTSSTSEINITARISDSGGIAQADITIGSSPSVLMTKGSSGMFEHKISGEDLTGSVLSFTMHAEDKHGNENTFSPSPITIQP